MAPNTSLPVLPRSSLLHVSTPAFRAIWFAVIACHGFLGVFYSVLALMINFLRDEGSSLARSIDFAIADGGDSVRTFLPATFYLAVMFATAHFFLLGLSIFTSVQNREFRFGPRHRDATAVVSPLTESIAFPKNRTLRRISHAAFRASHRANKGFLQVFGRRGWLGKEYKYANEVLLIREVIQVVLQVVQSYRLSIHIVSVWINRAYVMLTITNAWSLPFLSMWFRREPERAHTLGVALDFVLNIISAIAIPWAIFLPFYRVYRQEAEDVTVFDFFVEGVFNGEGERAQQIFATSWISLACNMFPGVTFLGNLATVKRSVMVRDIDGRKTVEHIEILAGESLVLFPTMGSRLRRYLSAACRIVLITCGLVVLLAHVQVTWASANAASRGCIHGLRPWFNTTYTCQVIELSCLQHHINGFANELGQILRDVASTSIKVLIFSHCSNFEMPKEVLHLANLNTLKVFNCSLSLWDVKTALTESTNPHLRTIYIIDSNMSSIPEGLLVPDLPMILTDLVFSGSNLTFLPEDIEMYWGNIWFLVVEASPGITSIPLSLRFLPQLNGLSLIGNGIHEFPDDIFCNSTLFTLYLDRNPLQKLPWNWGTTFFPSGLSFQHTFVREMPVDLMNLTLPMEDYGGLQAGATPLCDSLLSGQMDNVVTLDNSFFNDGYIFGKLTVYCRTVSMERYFEIDVERVRRLENMH